MPNSAHFNTTRWTLVRASSGSDTAAQHALSDLCAAYYEPVVTFIQHSGFEASRARDLAHDFFTRLLSDDLKLRADPQRGRFRSYLLGAVKHFVGYTLDRERAKKRGGGVEHAGLDDREADARLSPDRAFDQQWAATLIDRVITALAAEYLGRENHFELLKPCLMGDDDSLPQSAIAAQLGMNDGALRVAVYRLRKRFRDLLCTEIAHTISDESEARSELTHLLGVM